MTLLMVILCSIIHLICGLNAKEEFCTEMKHIGNYSTISYEGPTIDLEPGARVITYLPLQCVYHNLKRVGLNFTACDYDTAPSVAWEEHYLLVTRQGYLKKHGRVLPIEYCREGV